MQIRYSVYRVGGPWLEQTLSNDFGARDKRHNRCATVLSGGLRRLPLEQLNESSVRLSASTVQGASRP
jgi:hypothetical protein